MSISEEELKAIREELKWITVKEPSSLSEIANSKGIYSFLVPAGCFVTAGVLARGLYHFYKNDSIKQQKFMRYRILSQGVTVALCIVALFQYRIFN